MEAASQTVPAAGADSPTVYPAKEYETVDVRLADLVDEQGNLDINPDVEAKGYFTVQLVKNRVRLQASGHVGVIPLNERVVIDVSPRVPVDNLSHMVRISRRVPDFLVTDRPYFSDAAWNPSLVDIYAHTLAERADEIASSGVLREYRQREAATSFPRGRVLVSPTVQRLRSRGVEHRLVAAWFERAADTPTNRCIKYALWFMAQRLTGRGQLTADRRRLLARLGVLYESMAGVELDHSLAFLRDPFVRGARPLPALRQYYRPALDIAIAIVLEHAVDLSRRGGDVSLPSFVVNMNKVFEDYLRNVLQGRAKVEEWPVTVLDGNTEGKKLLFDEEPSEDATPDIVFRRKSDGSHPLVVEVKNVPGAGNSSRSAIEQALTYGVSYRSPRVVLAHPRGYGQAFAGLRLQGRIRDVEIYQYVYDSSAPSMVEEEERFGDCLRSLLS